MEATCRCSPCLNFSVMDQNQVGIGSDGSLDSPWIVFWGVVSPSMEVSSTWTLLTFSGIVHWRSSTLLGFSQSFTA